MVAAGFAAISGQGLLRLPYRKQDTLYLTEGVMSRTIDAHRSWKMTREYVHGVGGSRIMYVGTHLSKQVKGTYEGATFIMRHGGQDFIV